MSMSGINIAVGVVIYTLGISLTVRRFGTNNRLAFAVVALIAPFVAVYAVFGTAGLILRGRPLVMQPCPEGLEDAERIVEEQRQRMFGGKMRAPSYAAA